MPDPPQRLGREDLRVALVHNLPPGGARRVAEEHAKRLGMVVREFCLEGATPVTVDPVVGRLTQRAARTAPLLRPPVRHVDLLALVESWRRLSRTVDAWQPDVILAHPCRYLQAPLVLRSSSRPTVYFCHEPRRVDHDPDGPATRNPWTRGLYAPLHQAERTLDVGATRRATRIVTNSRYTARRIASAYGRQADVLPLGVPDAFLRTERPASTGSHLLSVGALLRSKGHDLVIAAAALTRQRWPVRIVAPREDPTEAERLHGVARREGVDLEIRIGISDEQLRELYATAIATLYLANAEPYGLASIEAQACGSPVVVAAEGGLPETVQEGSTGWTVTRQAAAAAARVDEITAGDTRTTMSLAARSWGTAHTWSASAERMEEVLVAVAA